MGAQLLVVALVIVALVGAIAAASYVFAITAEREPDPRPRANSAR
jgi:hypothetical protein